MRKIYINPCLSLQNVDVNNPIEISVTSPSLQPFSVEQWKTQQEINIRTVILPCFICLCFDALFTAVKFMLFTCWQKRKRAVTVHVSDSQGNHIVGASVTAQQLSKDFPFGSAIAKTILGNPAYQVLLVLSNSTSKQVDSNSFN